MIKKSTFLEKFHIIGLFPFTKNSKMVQSPGVIKMTVVLEQVFLLLLFITLDTGLYPV